MFNLPSKILCRVLNVQLLVFSLSDLTILLKPSFFFFFFPMFLLGNDDGNNYVELETIVKHGPELLELWVFMCFLSKNMANYCEKLLI